MCPGRDDDVISSVNNDRGKNALEIIHDDILRMGNIPPVRVFFSIINPVTLNPENPATDESAFPHRQSAIIPA
jgi:hypothetical protein